MRHERTPMKRVLHATATRNYATRGRNERRRRRRSGKGNVRKLQTSAKAEQNEDALMVRRLNT